MFALCLLALAAPRLASAAAFFAPPPLELMEPGTSRAITLEAHIFGRCRDGLDGPDCSIRVILNEPVVPSGLSACWVVSQGCVATAAMTMELESLIGGTPNFVTLRVTAGPTAAPRNLVSASLSTEGGGGINAVIPIVIGPPLCGPSTVAALRGQTVQTQMPAQIPASPLISVSFSSLRGLHQSLTFSEAIPGASSVGLTIADDGVLVLGPQHLSVNATVTDVVLGRSVAQTCPLTLKTFAPFTVQSAVSSPIAISRAARLPLQLDRAAGFVSPIALTAIAPALGGLSVSLENAASDAPGLQLRLASELPAGTAFTVVVRGQAGAFTDELSLQFVVE